MDGLEQKFLQLSLEAASRQFREVPPSRSARAHSSAAGIERCLSHPPRSRGPCRISLGIEGAAQEGEHKTGSTGAARGVFELNESLDELREAKASRSDLAALRSRLESAEKNFQGKLGEGRCAASSRRTANGTLPYRVTPATRKRSMAQLNGTVESPLLYPESGDQRSKGIV